MKDFRVFRAYNEDRGVVARQERASLDELDDGDVVIRTAYSSVNYKDALGATGTGPILRKFPIVPGIDAAGTVVQSHSPDFREGDAVVVTGCGLGETHDGGYAEYLRVPAEWVIPLPAGMSLWESMALGTAGFTAALALTRMEQLDQHPEHGPLLITGATGGVGSLAVDMYAKAGYEVFALTGKPQQAAALRELGASEVIDAGELNTGKTALMEGRWGGALDNVGGEVLAYLTRSVKPFGNIASVGLAGGAALEATVMPFILRGVSIVGVTSSNCPRRLRERVWARLAAELKPRHLRRIAAQEVTLDELPDTFRAMLERRTQGRTVVRVDDGAA